MFRLSPEAKAIEMFPGVVRRTLTSGDRTTLVEVTLAAGSIVPSHSHPHEQIGYVVRGRVTFQIGDRVQELGAGDSYCVPGGEPHEVHTLEEAVCIDIFSPVREEFLD